MKHIKLFEQDDWEDLDIDEFFGKDEEIKEGDVVELIDREKALFLSSGFCRTNANIGWRARAGADFNGIRMVILERGF